MRIIGGQNKGTKLYTLDGYDTTRPTLDRVKEALFSKINFELQESIVLDLFSGSGALGLEALSRGASKAYLCDSSFRAQKIIEKNIEKTKLLDKVVLVKKDCFDALKYFYKNKIKFDIIFLDPPYKTDYNIKTTELILEYDLLNEDGKIIIETDTAKDVLENLNKISLDIFDIKKYGRVTLIFAKRKG